jgi:hypothetical protein
MRLQSRSTTCTTISAGFTRRCASPRRWKLALPTTFGPSKSLSPVDRTRSAQYRAPINLFLGLYFGYTRVYAQYNAYTRVEGTRHLRANLLRILPPLPQPTNFSRGSLKRLLTEVLLWLRPQKRSVGSRRMKWHPS